MPALRPFVVFLVLAGCAAPQPAQPPAGPIKPAGALRSTEADGAACLAQGHPIGTDDFARCLLRLTEQRRAGAPPGAAYAPEAPVKLGDWCYVATSPEPFACFDI